MFFKKKKTLNDLLEKLRIKDLNGRNYYTEDVNSEFGRVINNNLSKLEEMGFTIKFDYIIWVRWNNKLIDTKKELIRTYTEPAYDEYTELILRGLSDRFYTRDKYTSLDDEYIECFDEERNPAIVKSIYVMALVDHKDYIGDKEVNVYRVKKTYKNMFRTFIVEEEVKDVAS